jgi:hypothetical protein
MSPRTVTVRARRRSLTADDLSDEERELVNLYRALTSVQQEAFRVEMAVDARINIGRRLAARKQKVVS